MSQKRDTSQRTLELECAIGDILVTLDSPSGSPAETLAYIHGVAWSTVRQIEQEVLTPDAALANLRHAYMQLHDKGVIDQHRFAHTLLGPAIQAIETALASKNGD